jgi:hypothetical protein
MQRGLEFGRRFSGNCPYQWVRKFTADRRADFGFDRSRAFI